MKCLIFHDLSSRNLVFVSVCDFFQPSWSIDQACFLSRDEQSLPSPSFFNLNFFMWSSVPVLEQGKVNSYVSLHVPDDRDSLFSRLKA